MAVNFLYGSTGGKKEQDNRSVYIRVNYNKLNWKKSLSMSISKKEWDFKKKSIVNLYTGERTTERNEYLQEVLDKMIDLDKKFNQYLVELKLSGRFETIETAEFRKECESIFNNETNRSKDYKPTLTEKINQYIIKAERTNFAESTTRAYRSRLKKIQEYMREQVKRELYTDEIDLNFYNEFKEWVYEDYKPNTFGSYIRVIKATLRYFRKYGVPVHYHIEDKDFRDVKESVEQITLNEDEINRLFSYEGNERLERVRDMAKVLYYGCMRYSDMNRTLSDSKGKMNVYRRKGVLYWDVKQQKTTDFKSIPMHPEIFKMYEEDSFPRIPTIVSINRHLKELCEAVGIEKEVSSHDFRRSYVTNEINKETEPIKVRKVSGHKSWSSFDTYCKNNGIERD